MICLKIGIITHYYQSLNYGGILQAFALQNALSQLGYDAEQICLDQYFSNRGFRLFKVYLKNLLNGEYGLFFKSAVKNILAFSDCLKISNRKKVITEFARSIPHSKQVFSEKDIEETLNTYDTFICGSDVVWNIEALPKTCALGFVPDGTKKISFSASLGSASLPTDWSEKFLESVSKLDSIAVRESTIANELKELLPEKEVYVTSDPVLLLTEEQWNAILPKETQQEKYAFCYLLGNNKEQQFSALRFAEKLKLKSVFFPHIHGLIRFYERKLGDIQDFSSSPLEFVNRIKNASVVITDSFHAVAFCLIFNVPFMALKREAQTDYIGRVENLLDDVGLQNLLLSTEELTALNEVTSIDFTMANRILGEKRDFSINYLKENLK